jgi:glycosyltransferase involved in cell wall biosynthesis
LKNNLSIIIITKNEAAKIKRTVEAALQVSDDIIIIDSNSSDDTVSIANSLGAKCFIQPWLGYGAQKNFGHQYTTYDWILSIDADEVLSNALIHRIKNLKLNNPNIVYDIDFKTYFCNHLIRFGGWNPQHHIRLYNKQLVEWDTLEVHEQLKIPKEVMIEPIQESILHYSYDTLEQYLQKSENYTNLFAERLFARGKKSTWIKRNLSPVFTFIKEYIFKLGILDGKMGFKVACLNMNYTRMKYVKLHRKYKG